MQNFRDFLKEKHKDINVLNKKFGTVFWGMDFDSFDQINPPLKSIEYGGSEQIDMYYDNPGIRLDWERNGSAAYVNFINNQIKAIREHDKRRITTNSTGTGTNAINYYEAYENLDVYAYDVYPGMRCDKEPYYCFSTAFARGIKDKPFWIVECASGGGHGLWGKSGIPHPQPGTLKHEAIFAFANGAELFTHFQFATFPYGAEQLDGAILDVDNKPRRRYYELKDTAAEIKELEEILTKSEIVSDIAIMIDYDSYWALKIKPVNGGMTHFSLATHLYDRLKRSFCNIDVVSKDADISKYKTVILPAFSVTTEEFSEKIKEYVKNGGTLISTFLTSFKNVDNTAHKQSFPAYMNDLFGIEVSEYEPVYENMESEIILKNGKTAKNDIWTESLMLKGAEEIAAYNDTFRKGETVMTVNNYGSGKAYYIGTSLENEAMAEFLNDITVSDYRIKTGESVECVLRKCGDDYYLFVFNFSQSEVKIKKEDLGISTDLTIEGKGYRIIKK